MIGGSERKKVIHCMLNGVYMAAAYNPGAVVVLHTPRSCSHIAYESYWLLRDKLLREGREIAVGPPENLFVTGMMDREAVFGGEQRLRQCLMEVIETRRPAYILVAAGCVAGVIGDDVNSVAADVENITGIPILALPGAGFLSPNSMDGLYYTTKLLVERFAKSAEPIAESQDKKLAVVFGENVVAAREDYLEEMRRLLRCLGFTKILFPPSGLRKAEFALLGRASLVTAIGLLPPDFLKMQAFARAFAQSRDIPFLERNYPTDPGETVAWLSEAGNLLEETERASIAIRRERNRWEARIGEMSGRLRGKRCRFLIGSPLRYFDIRGIVGMLSALGVAIDAVVFLKELTAAEREAYRRRLREYAADLNCVDEEIGDFEARADFVLTTHPRAGIGRQLCLEKRRTGIGGFIRLGEKMIRVADGAQWRILYE